MASLCCRKIALLSSRSSKCNCNLMESNHKTTIPLWLSVLSSDSSEPSRLLPLPPSHYCTTYSSVLFFLTSHSVSQHKRKKKVLSLQTNLLIFQLKRKGTLFFFFWPSSPIQPKKSKRKVGSKRKGLSEFFFGRVSICLFVYFLLCFCFWLAQNSFMKERNPTQQKKPPFFQWEKIMLLEKKGADGGISVPSLSQSLSQSLSLSLSFSFPPFHLAPTSRPLAQLSIRIDPHFIWAYC